MESYDTGKTADDRNLCAAPNRLKRPVEKVHHHLLVVVAVISPSA